MTNNSNLVDEVGNALLQMIRSVEEAQERAARQGGLHPTDFRCIGYLHARAEPVSPKDIIAYLGLTSGSGTALIDRLEKASYIRRIANPQDRRGVLVALDTDAAVDIIALHDRIQARYHQATADLSDENLRAIATYLRSVESLSAEVNADLYDDTRPLSPAAN